MPLSSSYIINSFKVSRQLHVYSAVMALPSYKILAGVTVKTRLQILSFIKLNINKTTQYKMKTFLVTTIGFLAIAITCKAQWTQSTPNIYYNTGNVLIGTTTSSNGLLQINGTGDLLSLTSTNTNPAQFNAWNSLDFRIIQRSNGAMTLWTNTIERMRIDPNGNVGIGTTSPSSYFHGGNNKVIEIFNSNTSANSQSHLVLSTGATLDGSGAGTLTWISKNSSGFQGMAYIGSTLQGDGTLNAAGKLIFATSNGTAVYPRMVISSVGNVGIGTNSPDQALTVNGTIHSKSVVVDANIFPDYVFKPTYQLPSLTEVKTYIAQNHHLPNVPSAAEVEKNGLNLGEMNKVLVQKVEELTLYLIEQNKQLKEQNTKLANQQKTNQSQQKQIDELKKSLDSLNYKKTK
jgi:hypothetical protein